MSASCTFYYQNLKVCLVHRALWLLELMICCNASITLPSSSLATGNVLAAATSQSANCYPQLTLSLYRWYRQRLLRHCVIFHRGMMCLQFPVSAQTNDNPVAWKNRIRSLKTSFCVRLHFCSVNRAPALIVPCRPRASAMWTHGVLLSGRAPRRPGWCGGQ